MGSGRCSTMAITFDDYPLAESSVAAGVPAQEVLDALLEACRATGAPVALFVTTKDLDAAAASGLSRWIEAGHDVGNHTFDHVPLTDLSAEAFLESVMKADQALASWLRAPKLFRYPALRVGENPAKQSRVSDALRMAGYVAAHATITPSDWDYDAVFNDRRSAGSDTANLVRDYVESVLRECERVRTIARNRFSREIVHVLLLHINALNAVAAPAIVAALSDEWSFVSLREALRDDIYRLPLRCSDFGTSLLEAV